jgi:tetratricopeptide (TPR) repeat protein
MVNCSNCNKTIGVLAKKYYIFPGKKKGSFDITDKKIICNNCLSSFFPKRDENKLQEGILLFIKKDFSGALKILDSNFNKKNPSDWYNKGNILANLIRVKAALKCYDEALFLDTHYIKAWYRKGQALLVTKKYMDAIKCFENVIKLEFGDEIIQIKNSEYIHAAEESRKLHTWAFPASFCCMIAWILASREAFKKNKLSNEMFQSTKIWIDRCRPLLEKPIPLFVDDKGNVKDVTIGYVRGQPIQAQTTQLVPPHLNEEEFVDYCIDNCSKISHSMEPRVVVEMYYDKHFTNPNR